jgi:hypothetical protein
MNDGIKDGYRRARRGLVGVALGATVTLAGVLGALADSYGEWSEGKEAYKGGGYEEYKYAAAQYPVYYEDAVYTYSTGEDGKAYYSTYEGGEWSEPYAYEEQPADYKWEPAAVAYGDYQYAVYAGEDGKYYYSAYDGSEWSGWEDISGEYEFAYSPYANVYGDYVYVYGTATDGYVYYKTYDGTEWSEWAPVNEEYKAGPYEPYAYEWGGYNNVFWTGEDGKVYWNRYSAETEEWTGEKQLPYAAEEYEYQYAPYAIGYSVDDTLYAYAVTTEGQPHWNTFDGESWSGWKAYESEYGYEAAYQPYAYEYNEVQYIYTTAKDGHAYYTTYDGETWDEWYDLGENYKYEVSSYEYEDAYYLTYTGENGYQYYKEYKYAGEEEDDGY